MEDTQRERGKDARAAPLALRAASGPGASAGDSRETDNAASVRLVEPSGHKLIMEFFFFFFGFVRTRGAQQAGSCVRIMPSNLFCIGRRDSGSRS